MLETGAALSDGVSESAVTRAAAAAAVAPVVRPEELGTIALLYDISRELTSILDTEELMRRVGQRVKRLVDYQLFSVMLWSEGRERLEHAFSLGFETELCQKLTLGLGEGLCGAAARERRPVRVSDVSTDPRYVQCEMGTGVRSELVVPLVTQGKLIGVLDLESTNCSAFSEEHEQTLGTLAPYVAIALENARLYEDVSRKEAQLQSDLATAREIQQHLLPAVVSDVNGLEVAVGYQPAQQLNGDFYDFPSYGEGQFALAVGDVAGKGTAAALYGALAVGTLREHAAEHPCAPAEMLGQLNSRLNRTAVPGRFVAMVFGVFDSVSQTLRLANAGFPRPLVARQGQAETVRAEGVPLGLLPGIEYDEHVVELHPGDVVVFCSDGVHEAVNLADEEFGGDRLEQIVAMVSSTGTAQQIANSILHATSQHAAGNGGPSDDRTVVVLKVKKSDRLSMLDPMY